MYVKSLHIYKEENVIFGKKKHNTLTNMFVSEFPSSMIGFVICSVIFYELFLEYELKFVEII